MAQIEILTETALANQALSLVRCAQIVSLDDDPSFAANVCRKWFAGVRDALLRKSHWNFAKWYAQLPALSDPKPPFKWTAFFALPDDCLDVLEINECTGDEIEWEVIGRMIATNASAPINLTYTRRVVEVAQWDALFRKLFIGSYANAIAPELSQDERIFEQITQFAENAMEEATPADSAEGTPEKLNDCDFAFIRARY